MKNGLRICILVFFLVFSLSSSVTTFTTDNKTNDSIQIENNKIDYDKNSELSSPVEKLSSSLKTYLDTGQYPSSDYNGRVMVISTSETRYPHQYVPPVPMGEKYLHFLRDISQDMLRTLVLDNTVESIIPDQRINYTKLEQPSSGISTDSFQAKDIMRTEEVWNSYDINGTGTTIGIIDSGVDFGATDLQDAAVITSSGITANFDPTGTGIAITSLVATSETDGVKEILPLNGENLTVWTAEEGSLRQSSDLGIQLNDLEITQITQTSQSGEYRVGMAYHPGIVSSLPNQVFLFILVDSTNPGVYDTIYVDFDTSLALSLVQSGIILPGGNIYTNLVDWSLNDEDPFGPNNPIIARDIDGDGINDVSMGSLSTVIDVYSVSGEPFIRGIDPDGKGIGLIFDSVGHGTLSAAVAAGRGITEFPVYDEVTTSRVENSTTYTLPGSAPDAKIIATKGFALFDYILGWFWTAGTDIEIVDGQAVFVQENEHLVDISSNSWGLGDIAFDNQLRGYDFYSLYLDYLSTPNSVYDGYPGMVFVVSAGNGAPGYGTTARPAMASMAITVGASTYYHHLNGSTGRNDIAWFSGRGPSSYGTLKPDIITPAHTGFTVHQVITGYGNGTYGSGTFGGTSEAAPRAAGVLALLVQAFKQEGVDPSFENLRLALKSTARDLGFHPTQQGAGLVDAFQAVSLAFSNTVIPATYSTSTLIAQRLQNAYQKQFGTEYDHPLVTNPVDDFILTSTPENIDNGVDIYFRYINGTVVNDATVSSQVGRMSLSDQNSGIFTTTATDVNFDLDGIFPQNWQQDTFMEISITMSEGSWNSLRSNGLQTPNLILQDTGSGDIIADTLSFGTYAQIMFSGFPAADFEGDPVITFKDPGYENQVSGWDGLSYNISIRTFDSVSWDEVNTTYSGGLLSLDGNVSEEVQFGYIAADVNVASYKIPIMVSPNYSADFGDNIDPIGSDLNSVQPYQINQIINTFDWGYRPESGDFRYYRISVPDNATYLAVFAEWFSDGLIPDLYLFNSTGNTILTTDVTYVGGGFYEHTTSEPNRQNLLVEADDSVYTLLIHTADLPYTPGPYQLDVYTRYLTIDSLPVPNGIPSQSLDDPVSGNLSFDASAYSVSQFPELYIDDIDVLVHQGRNETIDGTIQNSDLQEGMVGFVATPSQFDDIININFTRGEKVELELSWKFSADVDMYVFKQNQDIYLGDDLIGGLGATPGTSHEKGSFAVDESTTYSIYIDYIGGLRSSSPLNYTLEYDSRKGPVISDNSDVVNIDTSLFPNGNYGMLFTYGTNFPISFQASETAEFDNHDAFTASIQSPNDGAVVDGMVEVSWTSSVDTVVDVYVEIQNVQHMVSTGVSDTSTTFDSTVFPNGEARIIIFVSNGVFSIEDSVIVTFDNRNPSTLPPLDDTVDRSLNLYLNGVLIGVLLPLIIRKIKRRY